MNSATISVLLKEALIEKIEDWNDTKAGEQAYCEYLQDTTAVYTLAEMEQKYLRN